MGKEIALVELASHNEVVASYYQILKAAGFTITVYSNSFIQRQLYKKLDDVSWSIQRSGESIKGYITRVKKKMESADLIIFTTIEKNFPYFTRLQFKTPRLLVIHKMNMLLEPRKSFRFDSSFQQNIKDLLKIARYYFLREQKRNLRFAQSFDGLILPSQEVKRYLRSKEWHSRLPKQIVMEFAIHQQLIYDHDSDMPIRIVIPGIIHEKSRDYEIVIKAIRKLQLQEPVELILLGKLRGNYGRRILHELELLQGKLFTVRSYREFIPQREFDTVLQQADFLLLPMIRHPKISIFKEINGHTCVSGNISDLLRFGTPAIIPGYYPLDPAIQPLVDVYDCEDQLKDLLSKWLEQDIYSKKRAQIFSQMGQFTAASIARQVKGKLLDYLD